MIEYTPSAELERMMTEILRAPDPTPEMAGRLRATWLAGVLAKENPIPVRFHWRWVLMMVILVAVGACTCFAVTTARRVFIPEIGLIEDAGMLRVLAQTVSVTRGGITLTVTQVTADAEKTLVKFEGIGLNANIAHWRGVFPGNGGGTYILLPDGTRIDSIVGGMNGEIFGDMGYGYYEEHRFPALPKDVFTFTLIVPHLAPMPEGTGLSDWELPVRLSAKRESPFSSSASGGAVSTPERTFQNGVYPTVTPVVFLPTEPADTGPFPVYSIEPQTAKESADGISILPEWVAETGEGFVFAGKVQSKALNFSSMDESKAYLIDAAGHQIPLYPSFSLDTMGASWNDREYSFRMESHTKDIQFPVELAIPEIVIRDFNTDQPGPELFSLELGETLKVGNSWDIDRTIKVNGHSLRIVSADWGECSEGGCLRFKLDDLDPDIAGVTVVPMDPAVSVYFVSWVVTSGQTRSDIICGHPPSGKQDFFIQSLEIKLAGPWSATYSIQKEQ